MSHKTQIVNVEDVLPGMDPVAQRELLQAFVPVRANRGNMRRDIGNLLENQGNEPVNQENVLARPIPAVLLSFLHSRNPMINISSQPQPQPQSPMPPRERRRKK